MHLTSHSKQLSLTFPVHFSQHPLLNLSLLQIYLILFMYFLANILSRERHFYQCTEISRAKNAQIALKIEINITPVTQPPPPSPPHTADRYRKQSAHASAAHPPPLFHPKYPLYKCVCNPLASAHVKNIFSHCRFISDDKCLSKQYGNGIRL